MDDLVDRLYENDTANQNPAVREFHENYAKAGFKYLVTAWSTENAGGPAVMAYAFDREVGLGYGRSLAIIVVAEFLSLVSSLVLLGFYVATWS